MTRIVIEVQSTLEWTAVRSNSCGKWIAECEPLDLVIEGDTLEELYSVIGEASSVLFTDLFADNELEDFLRDRGWHAVNLPSGSIAESEDLEFSVPWNLVAEGGYRGSERHTH